MFECLISTLQPLAACAERQCCAGMTHRCWTGQRMTSASLWGTWATRPMMMCWPKPSTSTRPSRRLALCATRSPTRPKVRVCPSQDSVHRGAVWASARACVTAGCASGQPHSKPGQPLPSGLLMHMFPHPNLHDAELASQIPAVPLLDCYGYMSAFWCIGQSRAAIMLRLDTLCRVRLCELLRCCGGCASPQRDGRQVHWQPPLQAAEILMAGELAHVVLTLPACCNTAPSRESGLIIRTDQRSADEHHHQHRSIWRLSAAERGLKADCGLLKLQQVLNGQTDWHS